MTSPTTSPGDLRWDTLSPAITTEWAALTTDLANADDTGEFYSAEDLAEELGAAGFDPATDSLAVWHHDRLVGYAQLHAATAATADGFARVMISGGVHPEFRGRGIGTAILDRIEPRAVELGRSLLPGLPVQLRVPGGQATDPVRPLLTGRGYELVRYFTTMQRPLPGDPLPEPTAPDGYSLVPLQDRWAEALRLAHNDAFSTHWGSAAKSAAEWADYTSGRSLRPAVSRLVVDDAGEVDAYVVASQWLDQELYLDIVGTRQRARGQGLARTALVAVLAAAAADGSYDRVELEVDSANPTGAGALYASVGFTELRTLAQFARVIPAD